MRLPNFTLKIRQFDTYMVLLSRLALRSVRKSPKQQTSLQNRGHPKVLNDTKLILNYKGHHSCFLEPTWYLSEEPLDAHYSTNQFLGWDFLPLLTARLHVCKWLLSASIVGCPCGSDLLTPCLLEIVRYALFFKPAARRRRTLG